ncbi:hypothetical protein FRB94_011214 [Tulasnella sp. JGI-2019a]|nr:hypothetical protein FRB94_011214 [Tulasnella sp. JGI-2019a]
MSRNESDNLPVELLVKIFGYVSGVYGASYIDDGSASDYVSKLHNMAQVCQRWLEIIKGAAELWTFVTNENPTYASLALKRSRSHPFSFSLAFQPLNESLYTMVLDHSHRWRGANIRFHRTNYQALRRPESVSAPMFQHLKLAISILSTGSSVILNLFLEYPSRLTSLDLVGISIHRWNSPIFGPRLRSLSLEDSSPTRGELFSIFRACPALGYLVLKNVTFSDETSGSLPQGSLARLPLLHTLKLIKISPTDIMEIAIMIETPHCRNYLVSGGGPHAPTMALTVSPGVVPLVRTSFEACISSGQSLGVYVEDVSIQIICRSGESCSSDFNLRRLGLFIWVSGRLDPQHYPRPEPTAIANSR